MKTYQLIYPEACTVSAAKIDSGYDDAVANGMISRIGLTKANGDINNIEDLTTDQKAEELEDAGLIKLHRNRYKSAPLDLLDKIYRDPFLDSIDAACANYQAARREEEYSSMREEIEEEIEDLDLDLIWEAVGPDAYANHNAVGMEVRALIAEENWTELGRLIGTGAKAYLRPFAADKIKARSAEENGHG